MLATKAPTGPAESAQFKINVSLLCIAKARGCAGWAQGIRVAALAFGDRRRRAWQGRSRVPVMAR
jgi:hypothetical protein